jgi:hypothetical protein
MVPSFHWNYSQRGGQTSHQRAPGARVQEQRKDGRKGGSGHKQADTVTRASGARAGGISSHELADPVTRASSQLKGARVVKGQAQWWIWP